MFVSLFALTELFVVEVMEEATVTLLVEPVESEESGGLIEELEELLLVFETAITSVASVLALDAAPLMLSILFSRDSVTKLEEKQNVSSNYCCVSCTQHDLKKVTRG